MRELEKGLVTEQYMDFVFFKWWSYNLSLLAAKFERWLVAIAVLSTCFISFYAWHRPDCLISLFLNHSIYLIGGDGHVSLSRRSAMIKGYQCKHGFLFTARTYFWIKRFWCRLCLSYRLNW